MSSLPSQTEERRRSTRIDKGVALIAKGTDIFKVPYQEFALTQALNSYGCRYQTKHELALDEVVQLDVVHTEEGQPGRSVQARVKWVLPPERGNHTSYFEIAVELDAPGNVWGISNPPKDWSATEWSKFIDRMDPSDNPAFDRRQSASPPPAANGAVDSPGPNAAASAVSSSLPQFMAQFLEGLSTHAQMEATDAALLAIRKEKDRWLEDLRAELHLEVPRIIERVVGSAKDDLMSQAKEITKAQEAAARVSHETWKKAMREEIDGARTRFNAQSGETVKQLETVAAAAIEQVQGSLEESRRQDLEECIAQLRSQIVPLLEDVNATADRVKAAEAELKTALLAACGSFQQFAKHEQERVTTEVQGVAAPLSKEFEGYLVSRIGAARSAIEKNTAASIDHAREGLLELSRTNEASAKQRFEGLMKSAVDELNALQEKTREHASKIESASRRQIQFITELLGKFAAPAPDPAGSRKPGEASPKS